MQSQKPVKQVGGTHYQGQYQHWDLMDEFNVSYLEACASKYLVRWRDKGGIVDLEKSISYIEKRIASLHIRVDGYTTVRSRTFCVDPLKYQEWIKQAKVPHEETEAIRYILFWRDSIDLEQAIDIIHGIIGATPLRSYVDQ